MTGMNGMPNTCKSNFSILRLFVSFNERESEPFFRFSFSTAMKYHSILITVWLVISVFGLLGVCSCTDDVQVRTVDDKNNRRNTQAINLFPEEDVVDYYVDRITREEAFIRSKLVIRSTNLKQISNSNTRSARPFYVYQVGDGSLEKSVGKEKLKLPLLFVSRRELFKGKILQDSVYLYLSPIKNYKILQKNRGIAFVWMDEAPF